MFNFNGKNIIAAVRCEEDFLHALHSGVNIIFDLKPNIFTLSLKVKAAHEAGKKLFIHIDLAEGIEKDKYGILLVKKFKADGIISTRVNVIKLAREAGISTVQRFFIVDSHSVDTTLESLKSSKADMMEIMPGVVPKVIASLKKQLELPIIAGGLIETAEEIESALKAGADAISTGKKEFWRKSE